MPREKSTKPAAVRNRIKRANQRMDDAVEDIGIYYRKPIAEWDFEELQHGRPRAENGRFQGPRPAWVTPAVLTEARKRLKEMSKQELFAHASAAIKVLGDLMTDDRTDDNGKPITPSTVKLNAATYVLDHIIGKPTTHVEVEGNIEFQNMLAAVIVNPDGEESTPAIIPGEWEEVEDDE